MEEKYGPFGSGGRVLLIGDIPHSTKGLLEKMGILKEGIIPVDCGETEDGKPFVRFVDLDDRRIAVIEFSEDFSITAELRVDLLEWMGDEYFKARWRAFCPGDPERWMGKDASLNRK